jgi:hypothetical protein
MVLRFEKWFDVDVSAYNRVDVDIWPFGLLFPKFGQNFIQIYGHTVVKVQPVWTH